MRCNCCDKELDDSEATAKFVETDGSKPHRYVEMCSECRSFLPREVRYVSRPIREKYEEDIRHPTMDFGDTDEDE